MQTSLLDTLTSQTGPDPLYTPGEQRRPRHGGLQSRLNKKKAPNSLSRACTVRENNDTTMTHATGEEKTIHRETHGPILSVTNGGGEHERSDRHSLSTR